jgi:hypothetical protein
MGASPRSRFAQTPSSLPGLAAQGLAAQSTVGAPPPPPPQAPPMPSARQVELTVLIKLPGPIDPDSTPSIYAEADDLIEDLEQHLGDCGVSFEVLAIHRCETGGG